MVFGIILMAGLFVGTNAEFFNAVDQDSKDGMTWHYVGKQVPDGAPAITVKNEETGEEFIYFKMKK
jgi:hypothetical protein